MSSQPAKFRKRDAVGNLRKLAEELGMPLPTKKTDLAETEFTTFQQDILSQARTPDHRRRAADAIEMFKGTLSTAPWLPPVPQKQEIKKARKRESGKTRKRESEKARKSESEKRESEKAT